MYVMVTYFVTGVLPINGISFKSHELEEEIILTNHVSPYITLLVINSLGDEHSYSSIPISHESAFNKPDACWPAAGACLV